MPNRKVIQSEVTPIALAYFRSIMERLGILHNDRWVSSEGKELTFRERRNTSERPVAGADNVYFYDFDATPPSRGSWEIIWYTPETFRTHPALPLNKTLVKHFQILKSLNRKMVSGCAGIEAYELPNGTTRLDFIDRYLPFKGYPRSLPKEFTIIPKQNEGIGSAFAEFAQMVIEQVNEHAPEANGQQTNGGENGPEPPKRSKYRATVRTQEYGAVFKRLKDANPRWTQNKVAQEASDELGEYITADTVRNVYRAMGWKWERADRIRKETPLVD